MADEIKDGGPAFPNAIRPNPGWEDLRGISTRDYFAARAMQSLLLAPAEQMPTQGTEGMTIGEWIGSQAYKIADAMLAARGGT